MAIQASGWAPLTDAVVTGIIVPVVTLLPGLQDPVPTGASLVYSVVHRVERGQLAKETHHSYQGQHTGQLQTLALKTEPLGPVGAAEEQPPPSPTPPGWGRHFPSVAQSSVVVGGWAGSSQ